MGEFSRSCSLKLNSHVLVADARGVMPLSNGAVGKQNGGTEVASVPPFGIERVPLYDDIMPIGTTTNPQLENFN